MLPLNYWIVVACTAFVVVAAVTVHYEGLRIMSDKIRPAIGGERPMIVLEILWLMLLHITEIWLFAFTYYALISVGGFGQFDGVAVLGFLDCVYFSATVFTTLGFGDIVPSGPIRFVTGTEAVAGLTLITWSASYTFIEMGKTWHERGE
ncbi:MAG: potassium channel family protein [Gammaproteobacteria bacterium]|nr:potassium channel family protein [Gammaproteobacteria bacterium]